MSFLDAPPALISFLQPTFTALGLPHLAQVAHLSLFACVASFVLQKLSSIVCPIAFPNYYPKLKAKRDDWDLHVVGWAYSLVSAPLALYLIINPSPELLLDRVYGFGLPEARLASMAIGYFAWDAQVTFRHISTQGVGFFLHGAGCFLAFLFTLSPFLLFCGPNFLIWEISTIFLNIHWYLDKFNMTGSKFQLINGAFLISAYVSSRLIWGTYQSYVVISLLFGEKADPRLGYLKYVYGSINIMLNLLNFFWFRSMVLALKKRFDPKTSQDAIQVDGKLGWNKNKKQT